MRILFFTHYFPPEGNAPASRTYENCKRWVKYGHDVEVITCVPNVPNGVVYDGYKNRLVQKEIIDGIKTKRVWTFIAANKGTFKRIINYLSYMLSATLVGMFIKKPDIIIATSPQLFCGWTGIVVGKIRRCPVILEIRDIWPDGITVHGVLTNKYSNAFLEFMARKMYNAATHIVTVGKGYKHILVKDKGIINENISVFTNGADLDVYFPVQKNKDLKLKYAIDDQFICSYIGTIGMSHGLDIVIRAAKLLKKEQRQDIVFLFIGDGAMREDLKSQAVREKLDNIVFVGQQKKELIPQFYSISDTCLVHLKKADLYKSTLPSKIFEIFAMEKPLILGVEGNAAEIVKKAEGGICIQPENEIQLVEAIKKLANNHNLVDLYGRSGRNYVIEHFDRKKLAKDYLDLIEKVHRSYHMNTKQLV